MLDTFIQACLSRWRTVLMVLASILIAGSVTYVTIPKEAQPDIAIPIIYVSMIHEGISPEDAERLLVRPMETELRSIEGVKEMTGHANEGSASVTLEFIAGFDSEQALTDVREAVDLAKPELPEETEEPTVHEVNFGLFPVIVVTLAGDVSERTLVRLARDLEDKLEGIGEVLEVDIAGDREEVVEVILDPLKLDTYDLRQEEIFNLVERNNRLVAAGTLNAETGRVPVKVPGLFETVDDVMTLPVKVMGDRVITVDDVATVRRTFKDSEGQARVNGFPAIALEVKKRSGENVIDTIDQVIAAVEEERATWPKSIEVAYTQDQSKVIRDMLRDLQNNMISAVVLVMIVVVAALGVRTGILVGIAIPGSFLTGILVLGMLGLTVNIVVLFSLILAVGMLVDGAIVVTEFADRKMAEGLPPKRAYLAASQRMAWPIIASTATTLAAFMPLLFWPGMVGEFMKYLPITLIATLSASLAMALVFVPTVGMLIGKRREDSGDTLAKLSAADDSDPMEIGGVTGAYVRALRVAIRHPLVILGIATASLFGVFTVYGKFGRGVEFFPTVEPEFVFLHIRMRGNLSIEEINAKMMQVEERVLNVGGMKSVYLRTGTNLQGEDVPEDVHGIVQLEFADWDERLPARQILDNIREQLEGLPGIRIAQAKADAPEVGPDALRVAVFSQNARSYGGEHEALAGVASRLLRYDDFSEDVTFPSGPMVRPQTDQQLARITVDIPRRRALTEAELDLLPAALRARYKEPPDIDSAVLAKEVLDALNDLGSAEGLSFALPAGSVAPDAVTFAVSVSSSEALTAESAARAVGHAVDTAKTVTHVGSVSSVSGGLLHGHATDQPIGFVTLRYANAPAERLSWPELQTAVAPRMTGIPGIVVNEVLPDEGPPTGKPIQIEISSRQPDLLLPEIRKIRAKLENTPGLKDIDDSRPVPGIEWRITVDRREASRYGVDVLRVGNAVQMVTNGLLLGTYRPDGAEDEIDIRLRYPESRRYLDQIQRLRVNVDGTLVPIRNFVVLEEAPKVGNIERRDSMRVYEASANLRDGVLADSIVKDLTLWVRENINPAVNVTFRGENEEQAEAQAFLMKAFLVAMAAMAIILVTQFNNVYQAVLILTAVIFSTVGVFLGLLITHQPFGVVMNGLGVISLAGIVVNNNIVLIDTYALNRKRGTPCIEAILRTAAQRLRPVMLTTITTILGLLPMVLKLNIDFIAREVSQGAPSTQWWVQLATSVAFGLAFATLLTLVLTPALLALGGRLFDKETT